MRQGRGPQILIASPLVAENTILRPYPYPSQPSVNDKIVDLGSEITYEILSFMI